MRKINKIVHSEVRKNAHKGKGVVSLPKKYIGKRVKVIIYNNSLSKLHLR